jgi:hypothetical protein
MQEAQAAPMQRINQAPRPNLMNFTQPQQPISIPEDEEMMQNGAIPERFRMRPGDNVIGEDGEPVEFSPIYATIPQQQENYARRSAEDLRPTTFRPKTRFGAQEAGPGGTLSLRAPTAQAQGRLPTRGSPSRSGPPSGSGSGAPVSRMGNRPMPALAESPNPSKPSTNLYRQQIQKSPSRAQLASSQPIENPNLAKPVLDLSYETSTRQQALNNRRLFLEHAKVHNPYNSNNSNILIRHIARSTHRSTSTTSKAR